MSEVVKIHNGERTTAKDWAYVPDPEKPSTWSLLIKDAAHVRDALARFGQTEIAESARRAVARKLVARAKALNIDASGFEKEYLSAVVMFAAPGLEIAPQQGTLQTRADGLIHVPVMKLGDWVQGSRKVPITPEILAEVRHNFSDQGVDVPLSYDHTIEHPAIAQGNPIRAAGWLKELEATNDPDGVMWGWAAPTELATQLLQNKEYRYTSPAYSVHYPNHLTGKDQGATLLSLALTNRPFLPMPPITMSVVLPAGDETDQTTLNPAAAGKENTMRKVKVSAITDGDNKGHLLIEHADFPPKTESGGGYYANADETKSALKDTREQSSDSISKIVLLSGIAGASELTPQVIEALAQRVAAGSARNQVVELSAVPVKDGKRDYLGITIPTGADVSGELFRALQADVELDAAVQSGKILPAQRAEFSRIAAKDLDMFRAMVAVMRPQVNLSATGVGGNYVAPGAGNGDTITLSAEEIAVAEQMGLKQEDVLKEKKRLAGVKAA